MSLPDPQRSRAVLIGTSEYESLPQLEAVTANLAHLQSLFSANDLWGLPPENCTVLLNCGQPGEVLAAVREAAEAALDTLVVYFAGHGLRSPDNDELYLALRTTVRDRMFTALRYDDLRRELLHSTVDVASKVVLLDCCYSGVAMRDTMSASDDVAERARIEGTYLMTASASTVLALAPKGEEHTAFTGEIIDAMSTGIPDGPDLLNMEKIFWHVRGRLQAKGLPIPQQRAGNDGGMISLVRNRRGVVTEPGSTPRRRRTAEIPAGLESAVSATPQNLVKMLDELVAAQRDADASALLAAIAERVDVQEIAALLDSLPNVDGAGYALTLLYTVLGGSPERVVELLGTLHLLGQGSHVADLLDGAVRLAEGQPSQLAELARLLRDGYATESRRLIASAIRAEAESRGPDSLISLVGALWSAGLGEEIERTLRADEIDLGEVDALALAKALNSAGRSELAITLYLRGLDAVAALADEEIVAIVHTARECGRAEDAGTLLRTALRRRGTGAQYTKFTMALWAVEPSDALDPVVLEAAASELDDAELIAFAANLRTSGHAKAPFELYRKAAPGRSARTVVEFIASLRAFGRPVDALQVLNESATRAPADLVGIIEELRRRTDERRTDDIDRFLELVLVRSPEDLAVVIVGLQEHGIEDLASRCHDAVMQGGSAQGVVMVVAAFINSGAYELAQECAIRLITEIDGGPGAFANWLRDAPGPAAAFFPPVVAALDHGHALDVARALYEEVGRPDLGGDILERIRFEGIEGMFVAFHAVGWPEGLNVFFTSKAQQILDEVYAEYGQLVRSGRHESAEFLISQSALRRPAEEIPAMLDMFAKSRDESAIAAISEVVGAHRAPSDIATILNVLNLKGRRMQKPANEMLRIAAGRPTVEVVAIAKALEARTLSFHAATLTKMHSTNAHGSRRARP
jgi:hypothetical protein